MSKKRPVNVAALVTKIVENSDDASRGTRLWSRRDHGNLCTFLHLTVTYVLENSATQDCRFRQLHGAFVRLNEHFEAMARDVRENLPGKKDKNGAEPPSQKETGDV